MGYQAAAHCWRTSKVVRPFDVRIDRQAHPPFIFTPKGCAAPSANKVDASLSRTIVLQGARWTDSLRRFCVAVKA
jgi:hypothetical protein